MDERTKLTEPAFELGRQAINKQTNKSIMLASEKHYEEKMLTYNSNTNHHHHVNNYHVLKHLLCLRNCFKRLTWVNLFTPHNRYGASLVAQMVKNLPAMWETWVQSLGWEVLLRKGMATSSIPAWKTPWTEEPGGLQSMGYIELDMTQWLTLSLFTTDPITEDRYYYFCHFIDEKSLSWWQSWNVVIKRHPDSPPWVSLGHMGSHLISHHDNHLTSLVRNLVKPLL